MNYFRPINRDAGSLLPPSLDEWLPQRHRARFVVEVIDGLDLSKLVKEYRGSGSRSTGALLWPHLRDPHGVLSWDAAGSYVVNTTGVVVGGIIPALVLGTVLMRTYSFDLR